MKREKGISDHLEEMENQKLIPKKVGSSRSTK